MFVFNYELLNIYLNEKELILLYNLLHIYFNIGDLGI
jgi:hypothetical protein